MKYGYLPLYQADKNEETSLVSVVNKSQYCDAHSEDTIGNVFFCWFGAISREQHTIKTICMYVRTSHLLSHEICFYSNMNDFKEISVIS